MAVSFTGEGSWRKTPTCLMSQTNFITERNVLVVLVVYRLIDAKIRA